MEELKPCLEKTRGQKISEKLKGNKNNLKHGHHAGDTVSLTYQSWMCMKARCKYTHRDSEGKYARRGISMCEEWLDFNSFLKDMGERPKNTSLDRIDNNGHYCKENCKWSTPTEQARNRRNAKLTLEDAVDICIMSWDGMTAKEISKIYGCSESLPREVVKGRTWKEATIIASNKRRDNGKTT